MIDRKGPFCFENGIELLWPIPRGKVYDEDKTDNKVTDCTTAIYTEIIIELSSPIE